MLCPPPPFAYMQRGWEVSGGRVIFKPEGSVMQEDTAANRGGNGGLAAQDLINHCLAYAKELERIV
jgi:hypothetical protein